MCGSPMRLVVSVWLLARHTQCAHVKPSAIVGPAVRSRSYSHATASLTSAFDPSSRVT